MNYTQNNNLLTVRIAFLVNKELGLLLSKVHSAAVCFLQATVLFCIFVDICKTENGAALLQTAEGPTQAHVILLLPSLDVP